MVSKIADAGLLIAFLDRADAHHAWAAKVFHTESPPFYTCEAVLTEAAFMVGDAGAVLEMVENGDLIIGIELAKEAGRLRDLVKKYPQMQLADACVVRLSELLAGPVVYTVDRADFKVYRRNRHQVVPCVFPT